MIKTISKKKHAGPNHELKEDFELLQEVETRFRTTYYVEKRFLKSASHLCHSELFSSSNSESSGKSTSCFRPLWQLKVLTVQQHTLRWSQSWHASTPCAIRRPSLKQAPGQRWSWFFQWWKTWLRISYFGLWNLQPTDIRASERIFHTGWKFRSGKFREVYYHDMWFAATLLTSSLYSFHLMPKSSATECRSGGKTFIRKRLAQ